MDCIESKIQNPLRKGDVESRLWRLRLSQDDALKLRRIFITELEAGMEKGLSGSSMQMENTYVPEMTNGSETGKYLALDLGGTNFRVILLEMQNGKIVLEEVEYYRVEESTRLGPGAELFDFLADCIADFVTKQKLNDSGVSIPLGFTFSFPMTQNALDSGILVTWTKSFNCPDVVGTDAVAQLNAAIGRQKSKLNVEVVAILNDTTGTLVKGAYDDPATGVGLILGTGCNGAYLEKADKVVRWSHATKQESVEEVIIDPEWGAFGDNGCIDFIKSDYDREVDAASLLPTSFTYEKYFSGKYIGELLRRILLDLCKRKCFANHIAGASTALGKVDCISASDLTEIEIERDLELQKAESSRKIYENLFGTGLTDEDDLAVMRYASALLTHRCALLVGIPMSVFLERMAKPHTTAIAVTGSLYKCHPRLKGLLEEYTERYSGGFKSYTFLSDDGSGKGAGLVAAIAQRLRQVRHAASIIGQSLNLDKPQEPQED